MSNPFLDGTFARAADRARQVFVFYPMSPQECGGLVTKLITTSAGREAALVQKLGVKVGDLVTVSWKIDDNFGGGMGSHMGEVERLDTMIYVAPSIRDKGTLKMSLASIHHIRVERSEATPEERDMMRDAIEDDEDAPELDPHGEYGDWERAQYDEDPAEQGMQARENPFMEVTNPFMT